MIFIGVMIGSLLSGQFSDRLGRRRPFIYSTFLISLLTLFCAAATNIY